MCLAIPGKVVEIEPDANPLMAKVSFGGIQKRICLEWLPETRVGEYVLVHVGFAINKVDEQEALETLKLLDEIESGYDALEAGEGEESNGSNSQ